MYHKTQWKMFDLDHQIRWLDIMFPLAISSRRPVDWRGAAVEGEGRSRKGGGRGGSRRGEEVEGREWEGRSGRGRGGDGGSGRGQGRVEGAEGGARVSGGAAGQSRGVGPGRPAHAIYYAHNRNNDPRGLEDLNYESS